MIVGLVLSDEPARNTDSSLTSSSRVILRTIAGLVLELNALAIWPFCKSSCYGDYTLVYESNILAPSIAPIPAATFLSEVPF